MSRDFEQISIKPGFMKHNEGLLFREISENEFEFKNYLSNYDLTMNDVKKKIEIEVVWNKLIFKKYNKYY